MRKWDEPPQPHFEKLRKEYLGLTRVICDLDQQISEKATDRQQETLYNWRIECAQISREYAGDEKKILEAILKTTTIYNEMQALARQLNIYTVN